MDIEISCPQCSNKDTYRIIPVSQGWVLSQLEEGVAEEISELLQADKKNIKNSMLPSHKSLSVIFIIKNRGYVKIIKIGQKFYPYSIPP